MVHDDRVLCFQTFALDAIPHTQFCAGAASCDHMACLLPAVAFWMSLRHRTITQCFGVTVSPLRPNEIMLVTECASNTFERWLEKTASVSFKDLIHVIKELLKCLVYLHKRDVPICHGALNPANILVFEAKATTILKLTNIGAAFPSSCKRGFLYNAPEDIPSIKADMYALGVLIADIAMIKLYDEAANLVPLATSWTDSR